MIQTKFESSVLAYGDFSYGEDAIILMHSICHTGDIFGSKRCDCGYQLKLLYAVLEDDLSNVSHIRL
jgi:GTP cyclohydrolase II